MKLRCSWFKEEATTSFGYTETYNNEYNGLLINVYSFEGEVYAAILEENKSHGSGYSPTIVSLPIEEVSVYPE